MSRSIQWLKEHNLVSLIGLLISGSAAVFVLRAIPGFSFKECALFLSLAFLSIVPPGWFLIDCVAPGLASASQRWALVGVIGYAASIIVGYFVGVIGWPQLYLPILVLILLGAVIKLIAQARVDVKSSWWRGATARLLQPPAVIVGILICSGVAVSSPLMAPLRQVAPGLYYDYAYVDTYYNTARAQIYMQGAPPYTLADLAGALPYVYPDFHNFWIGQLARWGQIDLNRVYFLYAPLVMIGLYTLLMYAVGRALTASTWGGYIGAALPYVLLIPNICETRFIQDNPNLCGYYTESLIHFLDLRGNLSYGIGGMLVAAIILTVHLARQKEFDSHTQTGLLTLSGLLAVFLLRIRPHFFFALAPWLFSFMLWRWWRNRSGPNLLPLLAAGLLFALVYVESTSVHYDISSTRLAINYGLINDQALRLLPDMFRALPAALPASLQPIVSVTLFAFVRLVGYAFSLIVLAYLVWLLFQRAPLSPIEVLLGLSGLTAILASTLIVLEARQTNLLGDWGFQMLNLIPILVDIFVIVPLYRLMQASLPRLAASAQSRRLLGLSVLAALAVITYQGADAYLRSQPARAYRLTQNDLDAYYWITTQTPNTAVVAAFPGHIVNQSGETIDSTNFLSGLTQRPAYLQRAAQIFNVAEVERRRALLQQIFESPDQRGVQSALRATTFDYLLVYPSEKPKTDLTCCLKLVFVSDIKIYFNISKP
jgi:hypothetical protein